MPSVYDLKPGFQRLLRPCIRALARVGVTPNMITLVAVAGSVAVGYCVGENTLWVLPVWLLARMALNAIDGMMARELNQASRLGAILNELGDVISDIALYLPLAMLKAEAGWAVLMFVFGAILTEFCGVLQQALSGARRYEGPMGKSDRAFVIGLLATATAVWPEATVFWRLIFWALFALTLWTCVNRLRER